jgi:hypothetical protein
MPLREPKTMMAEHAKVDIGAWKIWNAIVANHLRQEWIGLTLGIADNLQFLQTNLGTAEFCPHDRPAPPLGACHATTSYRTGAR